jgi:cellulose synthase/poly-beta-1,6-N-acetylglucosamine synthase-like glycosyltransferase
MILTLSMLTIFYVSVLFYLSNGLRRLAVGNNAEDYAVSVIIAARNETAGIGDCLDAVLHQRYPADRVEIIVVDDRSTDDTANIVETVAAVHPQVTLIRIATPSDTMAPKKHALTMGIDASHGDIILITDADTIPSAGWVRGMVRQFEPTVGLVAGFAPLDRSESPNTFFKLMRLDSLALATVAAGTIGAGFPTTCTARSLAYRREVFQQVDGFQHIASFISGDDDLFMHRVRDHTDWQIHYAVDPDAIVSSPAVTRAGSFINQRTRHASKGLSYSRSMKSILAAVYVFNLLLFLMPIIGIWNPEFVIAGIAALGLKSLTEFFVLNQFAGRMNVRRYLLYFPLAVFFHIPYVVVFGLLGQIGTFRWKGKRYSTRMQVTP